MSKLALASAIDLCHSGMSQIGRFQADAMQLIDASIEADNQYCLPLIVKATMLQGSNDARFKSQVNELINRSQQLLSHNARFESGLLSAVCAASAGKGLEAASYYDKLLSESPDNLFLHTLAQEQIFWLGDAKWMRDITERAAPAWSESHKDYGPLLSLRAFANEEAGDYKNAEYYGRAAVEINPTDIWGAHAVAHVLIMQGRIQEGIDWLRELSSNWGHANQMRHHLWWHFCLFLLELGEFDQIIELLDTEVRNLASPLVKESPAATIDIGNYSSMLMRLELYGVDVTTHWHKLADICSSRVSNHGSAFSNTHDMMVLSGCGEMEKAKSLISSMKQEFASPDQTGSLALSYRLVGIPVCEAILAHRNHNYAEVLSILGDVRHQLHLMGASHAQRDVFYHLLVFASEQTKRDDLRKLYINDIERLGFCDVPNRAAYKPKMH